MLSSYTEFEIDDITGEALTLHNRIDIHYDRVLKLQVWNSNKCINDVMHIYNYMYYNILTWFNKMHVS